MINTLWNIRTEALMLEEGLSTILIAPLTGEVKDVGVNEVVGLASDDETEVVENASDDCCFHGVNPFFPWRSSLGVIPYALGVTISAGTVLCVSHPGLEPAMAALRGMVRFLTICELQRVCIHKHEAVSQPYPHPYGDGMRLHMSS